MPFSCWITLTEVPNRAAIAESVSPDRTVYVRVGEGRADEPGASVAPGSRLAADADGAGAVDDPGLDGCSVGDGGAVTDGVGVPATAAGVGDPPAPAGLAAPGCFSPERATTIATTATAMSMASHT